MSNSRKRSATFPLFFLLAAQTAVAQVAQGHSQTSQSPGSKVAMPGGSPASSGECSVSTDSSLFQEDSLPKEHSQQSSDQPKELSPKSERKKEKLDRDLYSKARNQEAQEKRRVEAKEEIATVCKHDVHLMGSDGGDAKTYPYLSYTPPKANALAVYLHGAAESADMVKKANLDASPKETLRNITKLGPPKLIEEGRCEAFDKSKAMLVSPQAPIYWPGGWESERLHQFIKEIKDVNPSIQKVIITGFSMGGFGAYDYGLTYGSLGYADAIVPVASGGCDMPDSQQFLSTKLRFYYGQGDTIIPGFLKWIKENNISKSTYFPTEIADHMNRNSKEIGSFGKTEYQEVDPSLEHGEIAEEVYRPKEMQEILDFGLDSKHHRVTKQQNPSHRPHFNVQKCKP